MSGKDDNPIAVSKISLEVPNLVELQTSVQSPDVSIANIPWCLVVKPTVKEPSNAKYFAVFVHCHEADQGPHWSCEASATFCLLSPKVGQKSHSRETGVDSYSINRMSWGFSKFFAWDQVLDPKNGFIREEDGGVTVEATITVTKVIGLPVSTHCDFTAPQPNLTDVVIIVEEKSLHVTKTYLAYHSPFFHSLFFSEFAEKAKTEIPLEDVKYDEFVELLHVIFPSRKPVTVATVESLLRLADRFSMQVVLRSCEDFLRGRDSEEISLAKKLRWSDQYRLTSLQSVCFNSLKSIDDVKVLKAQKGYFDLTDKTKATLGERILELS